MLNHPHRNTSQTPRKDILDNKKGLSFKSPFRLFERIEQTNLAILFTFYL